MRISAALVALLAATAASAAKARYDGHSLIRILNPDIIPKADFAHLDRWGVAKAGTADVHVSPAELVQLKKTYGDKLKFEVINPNIQTTLDKHEQDIIAASDKVSTTDAAWHTAYHNLADITTFYKNLAAQYPSVVKYIPSIGKSVSGKDIFAIEITSSVSPPGGKKNAYFQFNIHAREWISGALGQYFSEQLASGYGSNSRVTNILDKVKVSIVGVVNPDGYAYTWTNDRLWRKNRRGSYGVDLNRNYAFGWGGQGASTNPNDETYRGPSAASEPEVQATQNYFKSLPNKIVGLDAHSYSEYILRPYGYTGSLPPAADQSKYVAVANKMVSTIAASRGKRYQSLSIYSGLYPASGGASDYFYGKTPAGSGGTGAYGLSVELSPSSSNFNGFVLPPSEITPVGKEVTPAFFDLIEYALANPL